MLSEWGLLGLFIGTFLAATVFPFSSDALYLGVLAAGANPVSCLLVGTLGNWLGGMTSFWLGWLAKWEWLEKWFRVKPESIGKHKEKVDKFGPWLGFLCWVPFVGDPIAIALGFFRVSPWLTSLTMLLGKFLRFLLWTALVAKAFS